jgi:diaminopimelate epimerase
MRVFIMSGSQNTFMVVDNREGVFSPSFLKELKKRKLDGLLLLEKSKVGDFRMRIINPDGSEPAMCGNGARCIAKFSTLLGITKDKMWIETLSGLVYAEVLGESVRIGMKDPKNIILNKPIIIDGKREIVHFIDTGVPHTVLIQKENLDSLDVKKIGALIRWHPEFLPYGTNVDFVNILGPNTIRIRTYERGVEGETLACGTGAVGASCVSCLLGRVSPPVDVLTQGKEVLRVSFKKKDMMITDLFLEGKAKVLGEEVYV